MSKIKIIPVLSFILGLILATVGGTAYLHTAFASREYVKEIKSDIKTQLNRMEIKIDKLMERD